MRNYQMTKGGRPPINSAITASQQSWSRCKYDHVVGKVTTSLQPWLNAWFKRMNNSQTVRRRTLYRWVKYENRSAAVPKSADLRQHRGLAPCPNWDNNHIRHSSALLVYDWHYIVLLGAILTQLRTISKATMRLTASESPTATAWCACLCWNFRGGNVT